MSDDIWTELTLADTLADDLRQMVRNFESSRDRSLQTQPGPSEIGAACARCLARKVLGIRVERPFSDPWCAIIGTAIHAWLDDAAQHANTQDTAPRWSPEVRVYPDLELLPVGGSADLYDRRTRTVIDHKTTSHEKIKKVRANGPTQQYRYQAHLYGRGYEIAGEQVDHVAIAYWKRGGFLRDLYVWTEPYDPSVAQKALDRFRTIRDLANQLGEAVLPHLPADKSCFDCRGADVDVLSA